MPRMLVDTIDAPTVKIVGVSLERIQHPDRVHEKRR